MSRPHGTGVARFVAGVTVPERGDAAVHPRDLGGERLGLARSHRGDRSGDDTPGRQPRDQGPLAPGEAVLIPIDNLNKIYAITGGTSSKAWYLVQ